MLKKINETTRQFGLVIDLNTIKFTENSNVSQVEFLRTGEWLHPEYGKIKITKEKLERFVKNFADKVRQALPIDVEHKTDEGAVGWVQSVMVKESTNNNGVYHLFGDIEWTSEGRELIKSKKYRFFSAEYKDKYQDKKTGELIKDVLFGGAITTRPFIEELSEVMVLSEQATKTKPDINNKKGKPTMKLSELVAELKKDSAFALSEDAVDADKAKLEQAKAKLFAEYAEENKTLSEASKKLEAKVEKLTTDAEKKLSELKDETTKVLSELGIKTLDDAKELAKKMSEQKLEAVKKELSEHVLPKNLDQAVKIAMAMSEDARAEFIALTKAEEAKKMFGELGGDEGGEGGDEKPQEGVTEDSAKLDSKARKYMSKHAEEFKGMSEAQAYKKAVYAVNKAE